MNPLQTYLDLVRMRHVTEAAGLSFFQYIVLSLICEGRDNFTAAICRRLDISPAHVLAAVRTLRKKNLIADRTETAQASGIGRPAKIIVPTDAGRFAYERLRNRLEEVKLKAA